MIALTPRRYEIAAGLTDVPRSDVMAYRKRWADRGFELPPLDVSQVPVVRSRTAKQSGVGDQMAAVIAESKLAWLLSSIPGIIKRCGGKCSDLQKDMNDWGVKGCESRRAEIIAQVQENAGDGWAVHTDAATRTIDGWLTEAIRRANTIRATIRRASPKTKRKPYSGWRGLPTDEPAWKLGPFESNIRHLTYHIWPTKRSGSWRWNLQQLARRWPLFNGRRVIGIVTDQQTVSAAEVTDYATQIGMTFDDVITLRNNKRLRETVTWIPMLERLSPHSAKPGEVVFSAHAKGAQYDDEAYTRNWVQLMYRSCLDYWPLVESQLSTSLTTGSFREFGLLGKWHNWAYSGTFFWWRLHELGQRKWRDVDQWFAGTESWPGKLCDPRETSCLFLNNNTRLYEPSYWSDTVWPEWAKWKTENERHAR